jgi:hypothetical protein
VPLLNTTVPDAANVPVVVRVFTLMVTLSDLAVEMVVAAGLTVTSVVFMLPDA